MIGQNVSDGSQERDMIIQQCADRLADLNPADISAVIEADFNKATSPDKINHQIEFWKSVYYFCVDRKSDKYNKVAFEVMLNPRFFDTHLTEAGLDITTWIEFNQYRYEMGKYASISTSSTLQTNEVALIKGEINKLIEREINSQKLPKNALTSFLEKINSDIQIIRDTFLKIPGYRSTHFEKLVKFADSLKSENSVMTIANFIEKQKAYATELRALLDDMFLNLDEAIEKNSSAIANNDAMKKHLEEYKKFDIKKLQNSNINTSDELTKAIKAYCDDYVRIAVPFYIFFIKNTPQPEEVKIHLPSDSDPFIITNRAIINDIVNWIKANNPTSNEIRILNTLIRFQSDKELLRKQPNKFVQLLLNVDNVAQSQRLETFLKQHLLQHQIDFDINLLRNLLQKLPVSIKTYKIANVIELENHAESSITLNKSIEKLVNFLGELNPAKIKISTADYLEKIKSYRVIIMNILNGILKAIDQPSQFQDLYIELQTSSRKLYQEPISVEEWENALQKFCQTCLIYTDDLYTKLLKESTPQPEIPQHEQCANELVKLNAIKTQEIIETDFNEINRQAKNNNSHLASHKVEFWLNICDYLLKKNDLKDRQHGIYIFTKIENRINEIAHLLNENSQQKYNNLRQIISELPKSQTIELPLFPNKQTIEIQKKIYQILNLDIYQLHNLDFDEELFFIETIEKLLTQSGELSVKNKAALYAMKQLTPADITIDNLIEIAKREEATQVLAILEKHANRQQINFILKMQKDMQKILSTFQKIPTKAHPASFFILRQWIEKKIQATPLSDADFANVKSEYEKRLRSFLTEIYSKLQSRIEQEISLHLQGKPLIFESNRATEELLDRFEAYKFNEQLKKMDLQSFDELQNELQDYLNNYCEFAKPFYDFFIASDSLGNISEGDEITMKKIQANTNLSEEERKIKYNEVKENIATRKNTEISSPDPERFSMITGAVSKQSDETARQRYDAPALRAQKISDEKESLQSDFPNDYLTIYKNLDRFTQWINYIKENEILLSNLKHPKLQEALENKEATKCMEQIQFILDSLPPRVISNLFNLILIDKDDKTAMEAFQAIVIHPNFYKIFKQAWYNPLYKEKLSDSISAIDKSLSPEEINEIKIIILNIHNRTHNTDEFLALLLATAIDHPYSKVLNIYADRVSILSLTPVPIHKSEDGYFEKAERLFQYFNQQKSGLLSKSNLFKDSSKDSGIVDAYDIALLLVQASLIVNEEAILIINGQPPQDLREKLVELKTVLAKTMSKPNIDPKFVALLKPLSEEIQATLNALPVTTKKHLAERKQT